MTEQQKKIIIRIIAVALFVIAAAIPVVFYLILSGGKQVGNGNVSPSGGESTTGKIACVEHAFGDWITVREVTCVIPGQRFHTCTVCGFEKYERVDPEGHKYEHFEKVDPTCETAGYSAHRLCTVCGDTNRVDWNAIGHDLEQHPATLTCTEAGYAAYETCRRCDYSTYGGEVAAPGHEIKYLEAAAPTCDKAGYSAHTGCVRCEYSEEPYTITPALGHDYALREGKNSTCRETGYSSYQECMRCAWREGYRVLSIVDHDYVKCICSYCEKIRPSEGLLYEFVPDGAYYLVAGIGSCTDTEIGIPATYKGYLVKGIKANAFWHNQSVMSVAIEEGVMEIGELAFGSCLALRDVYLPKGLLMIGNSAFRNSTEIQQIEIRSGILSVGEEAFHSCTSLKSVRFPQENVSIGKGAFRDCTALVEVEMPAEMQVLEDETFWGCSKLLSIRIPEGVKSCTSRAFYACYNLRSITFPSSTEQWPALLFEYGCTEVYAPESLSESLLSKLRSLVSVLHTSSDEPSVLRMTEDGFVFSEINGARELVAYVGDEKYLVLPDSSGDQPYGIAAYAFYSNATIDSIDCGESVTTIGPYAFYGSVISKIVLPSRLTELAQGVFFGCKNLNEVELPSKLTTIRESAFEESSIREITLPRSVTLIERRAFYHSSLVYLNEKAASGFVWMRSKNPKEIATGELIEGETDFGYGFTPEFFASMLVNDSQYYYAPIDPSPIPWDNQGT